MRRYICLLFMLVVINQLIWAKPLTLDKVLSSTDIHFPQIHAAEFEVDKATGEYIHALGAFDSTVEVYSRNDPAGGYKNNYIDNSLSVPTLFYGLKLFAGYRIGRGNFQIWDQYFLTNSTGEWRAGLELPIFRNSTIDRPRADLITKQEMIHFNELRLSNTRLQSWQQAIVLYWIWVDQGYRVKAFKQLLKLAKIRQDAIIKRVKRGDLAEIDGVENEQFIVQREKLLSQAEQSFEQASINLSLFYRDKNGKPQKPGSNDLPSFQVVNKISQQIQPKKINLDIINRHPALKQWFRLRSIQEALLLLATNDRLPILNVRALTAKDNGQGDPLKNPQKARIGVHFRFPLNMRRARGDIVRAKAEIQRIDTQQQFTYEKLYQSLLNLDVSRRQLRRQYQLAQKQLVMAKKIQRAEYKRFKAGGSSLFLVNQWEQNTVQARLSLIDSMTSFRQQQALIQYFVLPVK